jgi:DNA polymerase III delta prime subunit
MQRPAQQALRRTMEKNTKHCRFILICNYIRKIINPIKSRCGGNIYHFTKMSKSKIKQRLVQIIDAEEIKVTQDGLLDKLIDSADGDIRNCVLALDSVKKGGNLEDYISKEYNKEFLQHSLKGDLLNLRNYLDENVFDEFQLKKILRKTLNLVIDSKNIPDQLKPKVIILIGDTEYRLSVSSDYYITAFWFCNKLYKLKMEYKKNNK